MTPTGQLALELGTDQAVERAPQWVSTVRDLMGARTIGDYLDLDGFTADDVTNLVGRPPGSGNAVGALFHQLAKEGLIEACGWTTSSRPERRGAAIRIWRAR